LTRRSPLWRIVLCGGRQHRGWGPSVVCSKEGSVAVRSIVGMAVVLFIAVAAVRADLEGTSSFHNSAGSFSSAGANSQTVGGMSYLDELGLSFPKQAGLLFQVDPIARPLSRPSAPDGRNQSDVVDIPGGPSGACLALLGLGTLGAVRATRLAKGIHLVGASEWLHTSGPSQIGHATAFERILDFSELPLCVFRSTGITVDRRTVFKTTWQNDLPRLRSQYFLPATAPRGPPGLSQVGRGLPW
jgi:hypothetical protein